MTKRKPTKQEDDVRRGLRTAQYNGIIDTQLKVIDELKAEVELMKVTSQLDQRTIQNLHQTPQWAEISRLKADYRKLEVENCDLKAENERLIKAGDAILNGWQSNSGSDVERFTKACWLWITAKEGKPSV